MNEDTEHMRYKHLVESQYYNHKANSLGYRSQSRENSANPYEINPSRFKLSEI